MKCNQQRARDRFNYHVRLRDYSGPSYAPTLGRFECRVGLEATMLDRSPAVGWGMVDLVLHFPPECLQHWGVRDLNSDDFAKRMYVAALKALRNDDEFELDLARRELQLLDISNVHWWPGIEVIRRPNELGLHYGDRPSRSDRLRLAHASSN